MVNPVENRASSAKLVILIVAALAGTAAAVWWLKIHNFNIRLSIDDGITVLRSAGPLVFFTAMALLPAIGFPLSVFNLAAGPAFVGEIGLPLVLFAAAVAIAVNLSLTYWLASYALRPWLVEMISRTKYKVPVVGPTEQKELTVILRITPGPPFFLQNYLLGLAGVKFTTYMAISWPICFAYSVGIVVFGDAILQGKGKVAFIGISILAAIGLIVHLLRKHYGKKRA